MIQCAITTKDNPFNPLTDFDNWYNFDMEKGYSTCCYFARLLRTSDALTDEENEIERERVIDIMIANDFQGIYQKVKQEVPVVTNKT